MQSQFSRVDPLALPQIQTDLMRGQRDLQFADALMNAGYVPNSGALGAVSQIAQAFMGRKLSRKADEKISDALKRQFEADNTRIAREAALKAREQQEAFDKARAQRAADAKLLGLSGRAEQQYIVTGEVPKEAQRKFVNGFWVDEAGGTVEQVPEYLDAQAKVRAAGRTQVNVNSGQKNATAFQEALGKSDADLYNTQRGKALAAQHAMNSIQALDSILSNAKTGKLDEVYGRLAQWAGTEAGADYQATQSIVNERVFELINALKGPATDKDAERAQAQIPNMGTDPRARKVVFDYLRKKAGTEIQMFEEMDRYANDRGSLQGFRPTVGAFSIDTGPLGGAANVSARAGSSPYQEGQRLQGPDGRIYVVRNGMPVVEE